jgi:hypothetical protein
LLRDLRHGSEEQALEKIANLIRKSGTKGKVIRRGQKYFATNANRMNYEEIAKKDGRSVLVPSSRPVDKTISVQNLRTGRDRPWPT